MDGVRRVNTICLNFPGQAAKPSYLDIHHWVTNVFGLTTDQVECLQVDTLKTAVYIKLVNRLQFDDLLRSHEGGVTLTTRDGAASYRVAVCDATVNQRTVRVYNLPLEAPDSVLSTALSQFGKVIKISKEKWGNQFALQVYTGVRIVAMGLEKDVPSIINVNGQRCCVNYDGQPRTCNICSQVGHYAASCPNRRRGLKARGAPDAVSYADRVRGQNSDTLEEPSLNDTHPTEPPATAEYTVRRSADEDTAIMAELPPSPSSEPMQLSHSSTAVLETAAVASAPEPEASASAECIPVPPVVPVHHDVSPSQGTTPETIETQKKIAEPAPVNEDEGKDQTPKSDSPNKTKNRNKKQKLEHKKAGSVRSRSRSKE